MMKTLIKDQNYNGLNATSKKLVDKLAIYKYKDAKLSSH